MRILWSSRARDDFLDLLGRIAEDSPANAELVHDRIQKTVSLLATFQYGQPGPCAGTFKQYVPRTNHFVLYRFVGDHTLEIQAFVSASMDWEAINWSERL